MGSDQVRALFDRVPYDAGSETRTRPDRLAMISWLNRGPRPPVRHYRLLELGCGNGANLIPLAYYHPDANFLGLDISPVQIAAAQEGAAALGLQNLTFEVADVGDPSLSPPGPFDFIIVHGLFSWVTDKTRRRILDLCREQLADDGLAYISYNVLPGWQPHQHLRGILRRVTGDIADPQARGERAAAIARQLHDLIAPDASDPSSVSLREMLVQVGASRPFYLLAEYLSEQNVAFEFRDFVAMAAAHDLVYVADADYYRVSGPLDQLRALGISGHDLQQTLDLFANRRFRVSLLTRKGFKEPAEPEVETIAELSVGALVVPCSDQPVLEDGVRERFDGLGGQRYFLSDTVSKALLTVLAECHPRGRTVRDTIGAALTMLGVGFRSQALDLAPWCGHLVALHHDGCLELRFREPLLGVEGRVAHSLAHWEARERPYLTTPLHTPFQIDPMSQRIIALLDGHHSLAQVVQELLEAVARSELLVEIEADQALGLEPVLADALEMTVSNLGRWGLLASNGQAAG